MMLSIYYTWVRINKIEKLKWIMVMLAMPLGKNNKHKKNEPVQVRFEKVSEEVCPNKMICKTCSSEWTKALFR